MLGSTLDRAIDSANHLRALPPHTPSVEDVLQEAAAELGCACLQPHAAHPNHLQPQRPRSGASRRSSILVGAAPQVLSPSHASRPQRSSTVRHSPAAPHDALGKRSDLEQTSHDALATLLHQRPEPRSEVHSEAEQKASSNCMHCHLQIHVLKSNNLELQQKLEQSCIRSAQIEEQLRRCLESQHLMAQSAEQERQEKSRALQEARAYRTLFEQGNMRVREMENEKQQWLQQKMQLESRQQDLQNQLHLGSAREIQLCAESQEQLKQVSSLQFQQSLGAAGGA